MLLREKLERVRAERRRAEEERRRLYEEHFAEGFTAGFAESFAESFAEGVAEVRRLWVPWYERFKAAEERGEPFDEAPPHPPLEL